jgi:hypothetical protein
MRLRPLLANLALALASTALFLLAWLAVEAVLHRMNPRYLERFSLDDMSYLHVYSERYGWVPRPGFRLRLEGLPETTIKMRLHRARLMVRQSLESTLTVGGPVGSGQG